MSLRDVGSALPGHVVMMLLLLFLMVLVAWIPKSMKTMPLLSLVKEKRGLLLHDKFFHGLGLCLTALVTGGKINGSNLAVIKLLQMIVS